ncbi:MAG: UDP-2,3-diacylglucosamine diphosphatase LpxI [Pseudomonadota bacterium]
MGRLAILAGSGGLPLRLAEAVPEAICISFAGVPHDLGVKAQEHAFEKLGALFQALKAQDVTDVVMAGGMSRPPLDPAAFDSVMQELAPRLLVAMQSGDDGLLRIVIDIFEEQGFAVKGAHEVDPSLTAAAGIMAGAELVSRAQADAARGVKILAALSPLDVGQGTVVEHGQCLAVETLQGTDAMLGFVAATPEHLRKGAGVFVKAPKIGQDLRVDMPAIGPETIRATHRAGLGAVVIAANRVLVIDRQATVELAESLGVTLVAMDL